MKALHLYVGRVVMVFDSELWRKNGGDSDTDTFMREATILKISDDEELIDVRFEHSGRISKGHFASGIEEKI